MQRRTLMQAPGCFIPRPPQRSMGMRMNAEAWQEELESRDVRICDLERRNEELARFLEELNGVVIEQDKRLLALERQLQSLRKQAWQSGGDHGNLPNERPPHY